MGLPLWHRCPDCDVCWLGHDDECFECGRIVQGSHADAPRLTSTTAPVSAMTDHQWNAVRRDLGLE